MSHILTLAKNKVNRTNTSMAKSMLRKYPDSRFDDLKQYLDTLNNQIESIDYIHSDPVQFMHAFSDKQDREIAGFFGALLAWGRRDIICNKVEELLERMDNRPADFVRNYSPSQFSQLDGFKHRTFKAVDIHGFLSALNIIYSNYTDFELFWLECLNKARHSGRELMTVFHEQFLRLSPEIRPRTHKHIPSPAKNSSCKRLYMYLRWCIRENSPVDSGIWDFLPASQLKIPLDVHVSRQARRLGLLTRKQSDWKAVNELTDVLRQFDPGDPVRYDYALFGLGVMDFTIPPELIVNDVD